MLVQENAAEAAWRVSTEDTMVSDGIYNEDRASESDRLLAALGRSILSGEIAPGSKLTEADLARRYGVSRAPLREALLRLEERQLIERVPYSGTRVSMPTKRMLLELYEMRSVLEGMAARRVAEIATKEQIAELHQAVEDGMQRIRASYYDAETGAETAAPAPASEQRQSNSQQRDIHNFHAKIVQFSGNLELLRMLNRDIWDFSLVLIAGQRLKRSRERLEAGVREHQGIVAAIENRDGELAEILMRRHLMNAYRGFKFSPEK